MKYASLRAFEKHLESASPNHLSAVYLILSKEAFERRTALDAIAKTFLKNEQMPDLCMNVFNADEHSIEEMLVELETMVFFAKKRVAVLHNADKLDKPSSAKLEVYFSCPNPSICLVLIASSLNRATNFYKKAEKFGVVLDIAEEKPWEREKSLADWLCHAAAAMNKQLNQQVSQAILKQLGTDQTLLFQELQKLACYVGERHAITEHDIREICGCINVENGWQLGEAIFRRDANAALRIAKALLSDGIAFIALLRQIRSQFQTECQICSILAGGGSGSDVALEFPYMKGQILERHLHQARAYGMQRLTRGLIRLDEAELQAKNSQIDTDLLAEMLMIKLTLT